MKCQDVEELLPELLDGTPDSAFRSEFENHLRSCPDCSDLVSDLRSISVQARELGASEEPPPRLWLRIAAELRAEGITHDAENTPEFAVQRPMLLPAVPRRRWNAWWMVPITAAILAAGSYTVSHRSSSDRSTATVAKHDVSANPSSANSTAANPSVFSAPAPAPLIASAEKKPAVSPAPVVVKNKGAAPVSDNEAAQDTVASAPNLNAPSLEDRQFLTAVSTLSPSMRVTYENQLQSVNADIRETQAYVNRNPGDVDARQHLMDAYQQKELLYQIALDRIQ
ncbi:MAG TPA: zf-HC2 domain-containing protein [Terriglobales bacterium]|nr:zf-HC2 domain-containing protein [Terriglobales bacterium]